MNLVSGLVGNRHRRFWVAFVSGVIAYLAATPLPHDVRALVGGDVFFVVYIGLAVHLAKEMTPAVLRRHSGAADEGAVVIFLVTAFAIVISLVSIFSLINRSDGGVGWLLFAAIVSIPLGWITTHTVASLHYAHLYYARNEAGADAGGIDFPGTPEPGSATFSTSGSSSE